jgi:hypothetical protein
MRHHLRGASEWRVSDPARSKPDVFFFDDFESSDLRQWDNRFGECGSLNISVISNPTSVFAGKHALELAAPPGKGSGASLPVWFMPGHDTVHARWYCKFAPDFNHGDSMHFNRLIGGHPEDYEVTVGRAGTKPTGADFLTTGIEPWRDHGRNPGLGALTFYTYYPDMKQCENGKYWGTVFLAMPRVIIERGRWYCMEMMVRCNTPGRTDGEQAAWVDGKQVASITGMRWRDTGALKVHCFRLHLYIHDSPGINRVWFDNVALSTSYIGPIEP